MLFYGAAGVLHLTYPQPFRSIVPPWVPWPEAVVALTGLAELAGAAALAQGRSAGLRVAAGWGLALYALAVWPANYQHMLIDLAKADSHAAGGLGLAYHVPRLLAQPLLVWLALWASGATPRLGRPSR